MRAQQVIPVAIGLSAVAVMANSAFTIVNAGERGVLMRLGQVQEAILGEGFHWRLPLVTSVQILSVRVQKSDVQAQAASRDLQDVQMVVAVNWHIDPTRVNDIFQQVGSEAAIVNTIILPAVSEVVKAATARKNAEEILTKRPELKDEIDENLAERLSPYGIILDDVSLVDISFSEEFSRAIEQKQIAEQQAQQAVFEAQRATQEAEAVVNRARGQAEAQRLLQESLTDAVLQDKAIAAWDGRLPLIMGSDTVPLLNLESLTPAEETQP